MARSFFRIGLSVGFSEVETLGQTASFERRLLRAAPKPSPCLIRSAPRREHGWGAERDKRELETILYFRRYTPELFLDLGIYMQGLNDENMRRHF